jgi:hypothetical protein
MNPLVPGFVLVRSTDVSVMDERRKTMVSGLATDKAFNVLSVLLLFLFDDSEL